MVRIMLKGEYSEEQDTREFFLENSDGSIGPIDRQAAGMLVWIYEEANRARHYITSEFEIWEINN